MTSLDSSTVGWSKLGNGETGASALAFFVGRTGTAADCTRESGRFMLHENRHSADGWWVKKTSVVRPKLPVVEEQTEVSEQVEIGGTKQRLREIELRYPPVARP